MGIVYSCPGVNEYGHGLTARVVHWGECCERFRSLPTSEQQSRGLRLPTALTTPEATK